MEKTIEKKNRHICRKGDPLSDFVLKILAVIIAVIIWFSLSITQYPTVNKTITQVPVDFSMSGTTAESKGLSAIGYQDITVDVEIQGMNYEIGTYTENDLTATVNLDSVTKEGTYDLEISVKSSHTTDQCTIISVTPDTVEVQFDFIETTSIPVTSVAPNVSAEEGYTLMETSVSPSEIEIEGAENDLEEIDKVVAVYNNTMTIAEDTTVTADSLVFYDADDNILDSSAYTLEDDDVDLTFVVYKKVTAMFEVDFTDTPPGFDVDSLPYTLSQESLQIISSQLDDPAEKTVKLNSIALYEVTRGKTFITQVDSLLSASEVNQSGVEQIEVSFDFSDYDQKTFTLTEDDITFVNSPSGKTVTLDNEQISNVTIFGPSDVIDEMEDSDLTAEIDLSDVSVNGSASYEVVIYSKRYNNVWNIGTREAVVTVADEVESEDDSDESSESE
ncbi:MAG: hypothetical protein LUE12_03080 [Ruminococcus sp.]|nr:hypothetical protein [Ruminococcus sp.]